MKTPTETPRRMPGTFSITKARGRSSRIRRTNSNDSRSITPSHLLLRGPAVENGWQGGPPTIRSIASAGRPVEAITSRAVT